MDEVLLKTVPRSLDLSAVQDCIHTDVTPLL